MRQYKIHKNNMCCVIYKFKSIKSIDNSFRNDSKTLYRGGNGRVYTYKEAKQYFTENDALSALVLIKINDGKRQA